MLRGAAQILILDFDWLVLNETTFEGCLQALQNDTHTSQVMKFPMLCLCQGMSCYYPFGSLPIVIRISSDVKGQTDDDIAFVQTSMFFDDGHDRVSKKSLVEIESIMSKGLKRSTKSIFEECRKPVSEWIGTWKVTTVEGERDCEVT